MVLLGQQLPLHAAQYTIFNDMCPPSRLLLDHVTLPQNYITNQTGKQADKCVLCYRWQQPWCAPDEQQWNGCGAGQRHTELADYWWHGGPVHTDGPNSRRCAGAADKADRPPCSASLLEPGLPPVQVSISLCAKHVLVPFCLDVLYAQRCADNLVCITNCYGQFFFTLHTRAETAAI